MTPLAIVAALFVGITLGLLGAGGSILTVPALIFALGVDPKVAIVMALPIVGGAALVGAVRHAVQRHIDLRLTLTFGVANMVGAYAGAHFARGISGQVQLAILSAVMVVAAVMMLRSSGRLAGIAPTESEPKRFSPAILLLGLGAGSLTGIVGIGGGFILLPSLVLLGRLKMREATGTSLMVIAMNTAAAFLGAHGSVVVPWSLVLWFGGIAAVGVLIGGTFAARVPDRALKRAFGVLLLLLVGLLLVRLKTLWGS